ncbi:hypothetical protein RchiOBHm_Chr5g0067671 [Rosa chinensis]|uniref:Uncharacterized protein n=1 Tax=Rosa chinensis TaxID=74649 RepID=A0A2P6QJI1_ROSCH|nr:uncharacterized protein LOC121049514 [Rosa chinensis]XP_040363031.1 uncharacterized protein LOC121049514 [Rosa chinensis]XP_040363032.1 uncharacterized protein LOC121049514 [Rosa chinensis]PRQ34336.1 hypothetical protein RchiOBHm_Chr5g0067671 [Rosa chinensis]
MCIEPQMAGEAVIEEEEEISVKPMVSTPRKAWEYFANLPFSFLTPPRGFTPKQMQGSSSKEPTVEEEKISVKLMVRKSRKMVCFAEAGEDFVNLLFSFLTIPLGFILKQMKYSSWKGCIDQLYKSVQDLDDEQYLKSNDHKNILLSPKIFPSFSYKNHILGIQEGKASYYYAYCRPNGAEDMLITDKTLIPSQVMYTFHLKLVNNISSQGFLKGPTMFIVTDKLVVRPISPIFGFSILNELKVPLDDIKEEIVQVGKGEVCVYWWHLLLAILP